MTVQDWTEHFTGTRALPRAVRDRLITLAKQSKVKKGGLLFGPHKIPDNLLFLLQGTIRVSQTSDNGREIVLYRVEAGESCVLTTACMLAEEAYNAEGIAETDVTTITLPRGDFDRLVGEEVSFRNFVFAAYSRRLIDLLRVVDDVAFGRMDMRLAQRLLALSGGRGTLAATHQHLASELGTAREVISRILQDFQKREWITQSRGQITILDHGALENHAQSE